MIYNVADNIITPLGKTSMEVFEAVCRGESKARLHTDAFGLPEPFFGTLFDRDEIEWEFRMRFPLGGSPTFFEKLMILSANAAMERIGLDPARPDVFFVLSSTKGNIDLLENPGDYDCERVNLGASAQLLGKQFLNRNPVVTVSNACTSGVAAQIYAKDILEATDRYKYAVVVGADVLSRFVVSGFQSFKALSAERCQPFDKNRKGLNLGEGAGTIILEKIKEEEYHHGTPILGTGNRNDANHISGPSRTGEGLHNAIEAALGEQGLDRSRIAFINAHGTATPYNDDMESWAIHRSDLASTPTNSLKAYFGHTLGAAGIIECIISSLALSEGIVLPSLGIAEKGVVKDININETMAEANGDAFLKIISGFGGSNAAIIYGKIEN